MRIRGLLCGLLIALAPIAAPAQEYVGGRDFLTEHEIDIIREAQDPNKRIEEYLHFALLRVELIKQKLSAEEAGRSVAIHRNLEEFASIIDAIDMVVEDALLRELDVVQGIELITTQEPLLLAALEEFEENPADDHWRYEFVLDDAIDIVTDSIELAKADQKERQAELAENEAEKEQEIQESLPAEVRRQKEKVRKAEQKRESKRPTLMKPGETKEEPPK